MENNKALIPGAIILAGLIIAGAVYYNNSSNAGPTTDNENPEAPKITLAPLSDDDHILGSRDAQILIVEYSDFECPFCKTFHETMNRIIDEYGSDGRVAWVYRHLPLQIHPKAPKEAQASECAAELGGNEAFWAYANRLFEVTPSNNGLDLDLLPEIAEFVGLDRVAFEECLDSSRHQDSIRQSIKDAEGAGARGTPYSVIVTKDGQLVPINGAQPYDAVKQGIDAILAE